MVQIIDGGAVGIDGVGKGCAQAGWNTWGELGREWDRALAVEGLSVGGVAEVTDGLEPMSVWFTQGFEGGINVGIVEIEASWDLMVGWEGDDDWNDAENGVCTVGVGWCWEDVGWFWLGWLFLTVLVEHDRSIWVWVGWWERNGGNEDVRSHAGIIDGTDGGGEDGNNVSEGAFDVNAADLGRGDVITMDTDEGWGVGGGWCSWTQGGDNVELVGGCNGDECGDRFAIGKGMGTESGVLDPLVDGMVGMVNRDWWGRRQRCSIAHTGVASVVVRESVLNEVTEDGGVNEHVGDGDGCLFAITGTKIE